MNNIMTIMKKELARFFGDKRMVVTTILLPGLMIYLIYSFMGSGMMKSFTADEDYVPTVYIQNMPESLQSGIEEAIPANWEEPNTNADEIKLMIQNKEADALVIFPEEFDAKVAAYTTESGEAAPNVEIYYNSANMESEAFTRTLTAFLDAYEASMANKLDVNAGEVQYDCASEKDMTGMIFSMMLPMLLMIFMFNGCMAVAPESIAGEKERGTIATLLVTPMKRSSLALGKVFSLSIIALLSGVSSFVGTFLSFPKMMGGAEMGLDSSVYGVMELGLLLGVVLSTVLIMVAIISVISALAKSVKEAGTAVSPLMIVIMFVSLTPMFGGDSAKKLYMLLIPIYNSVQCMQGIFSFTYEPVQVAVTILTNVLVAGVVTFVLTKMFDSEKVMFAR